MKKETLLTTAVIALLLLNFGTLGFLLFRRPPHPPEGERRQLDRHIVEALHFDAGQKKQFEDLKSAHHQKMEEYNRTYRNALENYFALLKNALTSPVQRDSLQGILSQIQKDRVAVTYEHFAALKSLCTGEQKTSFDALLPELMQVILPPDSERGPNQHR